MTTTTRNLTGGNGDKNDRNKATRKQAAQIDRSEQIDFKIADLVVNLTWVKFHSGVAEV